MRMHIWTGHLWSCHAGPLLLLEAISNQRAAMLALGMENLEVASK